MSVTRRHLVPVGTSAGRALATVLCVVGGLAIGGCASGPSSQFSDGTGFGLKPAGAAKSKLPADMRSSTWDVSLQLKPGGAKINESRDSWTAASPDTTPIAAGQFLFMVLRNPDVEGSAARKVASLLRDDEVSRGVDASEIADAEFMGLPAAMFVSFPEDGLYNVTLLTVSQKCVYILNVTREGEQQAVADWFGELVTMFKTYSGGPANAPACR
jgi:hypothetical protein